MLYEIEQKAMPEDEEGDQQRKKKQDTEWSTASQKKISKNLLSFLEIRLMQKEVLASHKLQDHEYEYQNPFELKEYNLSQRNCQNQLSHPGLSHIKQECQKSLIQGKIHNQQKSKEDLKYL